LKTIAIKFMPFWQGWNDYDNFIYNILKTRYEVIISDKPDYLICPISSTNQVHFRDCIKILYTAENLCPDFNMFDYAIGFDWLDYGDRYFRFPCAYLDKEKFNLLENKHTFEIFERNKFCNFIYSNNAADPIRTFFYQELSKYKKIDSLGKYLNNMGGKLCEDKLKTQSQYKFTIAFENSAHPGYTTEKLIDAFAAGTVPIYWGDPEVTKVFNPKAFINISGYQDIPEAIEKIKFLDSNDIAYNNMLQEPALLSEEYNLSNMYERLEAFLFNIFDQDKESAYRHNRVFWGKYYLDKQEAKQNVYDKYLKLINIKAKICPWKKRK